MHFITSVTVSLKQEIVTQLSRYHLLLWKPSMNYCVWENCHRIWEEYVIRQSKVRIHLSTGVFP
jgi:hypothetical protein